MKRFGPLILLIFLPLACGYANYADPVDSFSVPPSLSFSVGETQKLLDVSVTDSAVYYKGYYSFGDGAWHAFNFTQTATDGWIIGTASKTLQVPRGASTDNYVIAYTCTKQGAVWNCHDQKWQIKKFDTSASAYPTTAKIIGVSASTQDKDYAPQNTLDDNLSEESRWRGEGDGAWIRYEIDQIATIDEVNIAFYHGTIRQSYFDIQVSIDGSIWQTVLGEATSSGTTNAFERFTFPAVPARFVRIVGHGNSDPQSNVLNSYTEVRIETFLSTVDQPAATCSDGVQNQGETGMDCGGPCGACATPGSCDSKVILFQNNFEHRLGLYDEAAFKQDWTVLGHRWREAEVIASIDDANPTHVLKITYPFYDEERYYCWSMGVWDYFDTPPDCHQCPRYYQSGSSWVCLSKKDADGDNMVYDHRPSCTECPTYYEPVKGMSASAGGAQWEVKLPTGPDHGGHKELYLSYRVRFEDGFNPVDGGKMPGLCGTDGTGACPGGGTNTLNGDGDAFRFSARMMFEYDDPMVYLYYPDRNGEGTDTGTGTGPSLSKDFKDGSWHTVVERIVLNDLNSKNGVVEVWIDGEQATSEGGYRFRMGDQTLFGLNRIYFSTFFGGDDRLCEKDDRWEYMCYKGEIDDWIQREYDLCAVEPSDPCSDVMRYTDDTPYNWYAPRRTEHIYFDDVVVYYYDSSAPVPRGNVLSPSDRIELPPPVGNLVTSVC